APGKDISTSAGGYMTNLAAANQVFITRLADRQTGIEYLNSPTDNAEGSSLWLRQVGGHTRSRADVLRTQSNRYVAQMGGEILTGNFSNVDRWAVGLMAGYANQSSTTTSVRSRYNNRTTSSLRGYSVGLYGTWMENAKDTTGLYLDSWIQYSWFRNSVNESGQASDSYSSRGFSASAEGGYAYKMFEGKRTDFYIQPQMQLIWSDISADARYAPNGIYVQDEGQGNIQSRIGIKAYLQGHSKFDDNSGREFKPYIETNWVHNTERYGVRMDGSQLTQDGMKDIAEVKTGIEARLASSTSLWGGIGVQIGEKGYSDTQGHLGIRYQF
nr:autotransporter outer membrane beta-barrel domain-containing protein [Enterobacter cloacae]